MSEPTPADEVPFVEAPAWNPKALFQEFVQWLRNGGGTITIDLNDARPLYREYRWALERLLENTRVTVIDKQGRVWTFQVVT